MAERRNDLRIEEVLAKKHLTLVDLAEQMGKSYNLVYKMVNGNPTYSSLCTIARVLGVHVRDLMPLRPANSEVKVATGPFYDELPFEKSPSDLPFQRPKVWHCPKCGQQFTVDDPD